jgi:hypothetical protein
MKDLTEHKQVLKKTQNFNQMWWFTPMIPAAHEVKGGGMAVQG